MFAIAARLRAPELHPSQSPDLSNVKQSKPSLSQHSSFNSTGGFNIDDIQNRNELKLAQLKELDSKLKPGGGASELQLGSPPASGRKPVVDGRYEADLVINFLNNRRVRTRLLRGKRAYSCCCCFFATRAERARHLVIARQPPAAAAGDRAAELVQPAQHRCLH